MPGTEPGTTSHSQPECSTGQDEQAPGAADGDPRQGQSAVLRYRACGPLHSGPVAAFSEGAACGGPQRRHCLAACRSEASASSRVPLMPAKASDRSHLAVALGTEDRPFLLRVGAGDAPAAKLWQAATTAVSPASLASLEAFAAEEQHPVLQQHLQRTQQCKDELSVRGELQLDIVADVAGESGESQDEQPSVLVLLSSPTR
eukprot:TRINITY_DN18508_c0_g1_i1.p1 TRINITY_DN18508_c0_g1~~TRINITY_DN18508_c0_g1_i1.p1  ORF type:complete len:202 (+),score=40.00 TRINITY_DN18508_c0_g1_i1:487-1092(+)